LWKRGAAAEERLPVVCGTMRLTGEGEGRSEAEGRMVAIKLAHENFSERFDREARAIAALNHPNICQTQAAEPETGNNPENSPTLSLAAPKVGMILGTAAHNERGQ
jgi:hypothetical protein